MRLQLWPALGSELRLLPGPRRVSPLQLQLWPALGSELRLLPGQTELSPLQLGLAGAGVGTAALRPRGRRCSWDSGTAAGPSQDCRTSLPKPGCGRGTGSGCACNRGGAGSGGLVLARRPLCSRRRNLVACPGFLGLLSLGNTIVGRH